jgi:thioredoxin reductase (NADPH)
MPKTPYQTDVVIVGAGPVGLFAIFQCGMLNMSCHVVDALETAGGQLSALYPEKPIYDIPGFRSISAADLIANLEEQVAPFDPRYHFNERAESLAKTDEGRWRIKTSKGNEINAGAVIIAAGVGAFGPNRPPLEGIERYEGRGVHYLVSSRGAFSGKKVVIAGGGDSAVDWAISLSEVAEKITIVHRRAKFRASPGSAEKLQKLAEEGVIDIMTPFQLAGLEGDEEKLSGVVIADLDGQTKRIAADILLPFFGLSQDIGPLAEWDLTLDGGKIVVDPATMGASPEGLFAIGDIAAYPGKLKLILSGFSEAATAAHAAYLHLHPGEALHFEHSTDKGIPAQGK